MEKKLFMIVLFMVSLVALAQDNTFTPYEKALEGNKRPDDCLYWEISRDQRLVVWRGESGKPVSYVLEAEQAGYRFLKLGSNTEETQSNIYRNCSKGFLLEIRVWYGRVSFWLTYVPKEYRSENLYFALCN